MQADLRCVSCESHYDADTVLYECPKCHAPLTIDLFLPEARVAETFERIRERPLSVWRYRELLPAGIRTEVISLGEGGTQLHRCHRLGRELGLVQLYIKNEGENPTGSFKDRGMTVGVTRARELGFETVICASTGNTSASLAAYAALGGLRCIVLVPRAKVAQGKLAQAMIHGALVLAVEGSFDDALHLVMQASRELGLYLLNSINPYRHEGQKTAAYEICDQLAGEAPDWVVCPVGNGGNIAAYWKGFAEYHRYGEIEHLPRLAGIQAEGAAPIVSAIEQGAERIEPVAEPETIATAIRIGNPANWPKTLRAIRESRGTARAVSDQEILDAQRLLACTEGVFVEPASAASLAGLRRLLQDGTISRTETIVCVVTGHGLKDPDAAIAQSKPFVEIAPTLPALKRVLEAHPRGG